MSFYGTEYDDPFDPGPEGNEPVDPMAGVRSRFVTGGTFVLDAPDKVPAVWGDEDRVAWAEGEALIIAGPSGVGKTTIAGQLVRGMIVRGDRERVLGLTVRPRDRVLYLAMDRPRQAARALRRTLGEIPREELDERLMFWPGPPLADIAKHPETLLALAETVGADIVVVDSLKDAAVGLSDDEVGAGYNRARQMVLAAGIDVLELHHLVKRGANGSTPTALTDLYGSVWITAGAGSVLLLWGEAGDPIVDLKHLKQPVEDIGPMKVMHDHDAGTSAVWHSTDLVAMASRPQGVTAKEAAVALFDTDKPDAKATEKARRKLAGLVKSGTLIEQPGDKTTNTPTRWHHATLTTITQTITAPDPREPFTTPTQASRPEEEPQVRTITDTFTTITQGDLHVLPPSCKEGENVGQAPEATCKACGDTLSELRALAFDTCPECRETA